MLKRDITYEDADGETITETFYFNLTKKELVKMQVSYKGGIEAAIRAIIKSDDSNALFEEFDKVILASYGLRSEDGKRFMKSDKIREEFADSFAYDALFMDLITNEDKAAEFITSVIPRDWATQIANTPGIVEVPLPPAPPSNT